MYQPDEKMLQKYAELMNGIFHVDAEEGAGAAFSVHFPL